MNGLLCSRGDVVAGIKIHINQELMAGLKTAKFKDFTPETINLQMQKMTHGEYLRHIEGLGFSKVKPYGSALHCETKPYSKLIL